MRRTKITLQQLETFLYKSADKLRSQMDASQYKEYIFGLLFLKRLSDVFDEKRIQLRKDYKHLSPERLKEILEIRTTYGDTIFIVLDGMSLGLRHWRTETNSLGRRSRILRQASARC